SVLSNTVRSPASCTPTAPSVRALASALLTWPHRAEMTKLTKIANTNPTKPKANIVPSLNSPPLSRGNRCRTYNRISTAPPATRTMSPSNSSHGGTLLTNQRLTATLLPHRAGNPCGDRRITPGVDKHSDVSTLGRQIPA